MIQNMFLDHIAPTLKEGELRCMLYLFRRINGFHKDGDFVALSQFEDGIVVNGEKKDEGTGLSRKAIRDALKGLLARKLITRVAWCYKCKKQVEGRRCECKADKMLGHYFTIILSDHTPDLRVTSVSSGNLQVTSGPDNGLLEDAVTGNKETPQKKEKLSEKKKEKKRAEPAPDSTDKLYRACSDQFYIRYASEIAGTNVDMSFIQDHEEYKPKYGPKDWNALKWMREEGELTPKMVDFFWSLAARDKSEYVSSSRLYIWFYKKEWNYYHREWMKSSFKQSQDKEIEGLNRKKREQDKYLEDVDAGRTVPRSEVAKVFHGIASIAKGKNMKDT